MSTKIQEKLGQLPAWEAALANDGYISDEQDEKLTIREAFSSPDAPILFPKAISNTLREAAEPQLLVTPMLSVVRLENGRAMEFPAVNAIQAAEIPEGQEYPEQQLAFMRQIEGRVSKKGVKVSFTEEVIADSLWDIVGLHVRAAGRAMARLKEQIALQRFFDYATTVFDNDDSDYPNTTGRGIDGELNNAYTWDDVVDQAAQLMWEGHVPTDFIAHPVAWAIFQKDPVFRQNGVAGGEALGGRTMDTRPGATFSGAAPLGLNFIISPFVNFEGRNHDDDEPAKTDVFLIDRNEVGVLLVRDDMSTDEWDDQTRDVRTLKMKERYDIQPLGEGEGITVAKNVAVKRSYETYLTSDVQTS